MIPHRDIAGPPGPEPPLLDGNAWLCILIVVVVLLLAWCGAGARPDCTKKACPAGYKAQVLDNRCLCVERPR